MNFTEISPTLILAAVGQLAATVWFFIKLYFKVESMVKKVQEIESENKELKKQLADMKDILLIVKHTTDLLYLGKIKTGRNQEAA